jgi:hypothetical protein
MSDSVLFFPSFAASEVLPLSSPPTNATFTNVINPYWR